MHRRPASLLLVVLALLLTSCAGLKRHDGPSGSLPRQPDDAIPKKEPRSRYGNGPVYEVLGRRYTVMPSSHGYQERGVASWYGKKFHGNLTSNREVYDMYAMTAAHKSLPLPSYVRVRNLRNNRAIVVRVNDRGPFVHNRIIDLSYAAALKLDMVQDGTSLVEVTAINLDTPRAAPPAPGPASESRTTESQRIFVQVGAFGDKSNALRRLAALQRAGIGGGFLHEDLGNGALLYRVRIGPVADVVQYDRLVENLGAIGITDPYLISD